MNEIFRKMWTLNLRIVCKINSKKNNVKRTFQGCKEFLHMNGDSVTTNDEAITVDGQKLKLDNYTIRERVSANFTSSRHGSVKCTEQGRDVSTQED